VRGRLKGYRVVDGEKDEPVRNGLFIAAYEFQVALHLANTMRDDLNANVA
jgi:hypothetical protein